MLVVNRFVVADEEAFVGRAHAALAALAARPGYVRGQLARALDEPQQWCLLTEWESVGTYRRALGAFEVKVSATPLLAESLEGPSAYEALATAPPGGAVAVAASDRAEAWASDRAGSGPADRAGSGDGRRGGDARTTIAE